MAHASVDWQFRSWQVAHVPKLHLEEPCCDNSQRTYVCAGAPALLSKIMSVAVHMCVYWTCNSKDATPRPRSYAVSESPYAMVASISSMAFEESS